MTDKGGFWELVSLVTWIIVMLYFIGVPSDLLGGFMLIASALVIVIEIIIEPKVFGL